MTLSLDNVLTLLSLAFSVFGYIQGQHLVGWRGWYRSFWIPVILLLLVLVVLNWLHGLEVTKASEDIFTFLERHPRKSITQIYSELYPRQSLDVVTAALKSLHESGRLYVETLTFNLSGGDKVAVETYSAIQ